MSVSDSFVDAVTDGPLLVALPVAAIAGLVSFLSPCVLPLVPGYLSYVTGLSGADLGDTRGEPEPEAGTVATKQSVRVRGRVLAGSVLFVLGFSAVFVTGGAFFGGLGNDLIANAETVNRVLGVVTVIMGLAFMGLIPGMQREVKIRQLPVSGLAGAPLLGVVFGVGWTPCLGPTIGAVQSLAYSQASAGRGAILTAAYCAGLGIPFVLTGLAMRRALGAFDVVKRHYALVTRIGGVLLIVVGLLLVSGLWTELTIQLRSTVGPGDSPL
jgi:cytochrome c-type biogenesis protein